MNWSYMINVRQMRFVLMIFWSVTSIDAFGQFGGGGAKPTTGRLIIEIPEKSGVYSATIQVFREERWVATREVKMDSLTDRARIANVQNLLEGPYSIKIITNSGTEYTKEAYVRAERDPVRIYISNPSQRIARQQTAKSPSDTSSAFQAPMMIEDVMMRLDNFEQRLTIMEKSKAASIKNSGRNRDRRGKRTVLPPELESAPEFDPEPELDTPKLKIVRADSLEIF